MRRRKGLEAGLWAHPLGDRSARPAHCSSHLYFETKQSESQTLDGGVQHPPSCSQPVRCCTDNLRITSLQAFSKYLVVYVYLNGSMLSGPSPCPSPRFFGVASVPVFSKMTPGPCGGCFASESSCRWDQSIDKLSTPLRRLFWKDRAIAGAQSAGGGHTGRAVLLLATSPRPCPPASCGLRFFSGRVPSQASVWCLVCQGFVGAQQHIGVRENGCP